MGAVDVPPFTACSSVRFGRSNWTTTIQLPIHGCSTRIPLRQHPMSDRGGQRDLPVAGAQAEARAAIAHRSALKTYSHGAITGLSRGFPPWLAGIATGRIAIAKRLLG